MKRSASLLTAAVAALLLAGTSATASPIEWSYNWSPSSTLLTANTGPSQIKLSNETTKSAAGDSDTVITNIDLFSTKPRSTPDEFFDNNANGQVTFSLTLTDIASGESALLKFKAQFFGELSGSSARIRFKPLDETAFSPVLGDNQYSVSLEFYTPPAPPDADQLGGLSANIEVRPVDIQKVPEPTTLALSCIGLAGLGLRNWRKRRQSVAATV